VQDNRPLLFCTALIACAAVGLQAAGWPVLLFIGTIEPYIAFLLAGLVGLALRVLVIRLQVRDAEGRRVRDVRTGWSCVYHRAREDFLNPLAIGRASGALLCTAFCLAVFCGWKRLVPQVTPFYLDPALERWDTLLHGGVPSWVWLEPLNLPWLTRLLDHFYFYSLAGFLVALGWIVWSRHTIRNRVLVAYVVLWVLLGNVAATLFSSAGPAFMAGSFEAQREYLRGIPGLISVGAQRAMWFDHVSGGVNPYAAISAMPSLHVATPTLLLLAGIRRYPWMRWPGVLYIAVTVVAAVHLGWHYAIDGYVAILAVWVYWTIAPMIEWRVSQAWESLCRVLRWLAGRRGRGDPVPGSALAQRSRW